MSEKVDTIRACKIIMKRTFGVSIPDAILEFTYNATEKFAQDPANRKLKPSALLKDMTIKKKVAMIGGRLSQRFNNVA